MYYLDTEEYYQRRLRTIELAILRRAYYAGSPYVDDEETGYERDVWVNQLSPTDDIADYPNYIDNIAKIIVDNTVDDVLPANTQLVLPGVDDKTMKKLGRQIFNFGPAHPTGIKAFRQWAPLILQDVAQAGDGALFLRLMPATDTAPPKIRIHYYPMEAWDAEIDTDTGDVKFYRFEYKFKGVVMVQGNVTTKIFWRRFDVWRDHIVRYADQQQPIASIYDDGNPPPNVLPTADEYSCLMPPIMYERQPTPEEEIIWASERKAMQDLDEWLVIPLLWDHLDVEHIRGRSCLCKSRMSAIDDCNRLLTKWKEAAIMAGDPDKIAIDLQLPGESGSEDSEATADDVRVGDIINAVSTGDGAGYYGYAQNQPDEFPHKEPLDAIREAVFQGAPNFSLNPEKISRYGELSGFAANQLNHNHNQRVMRLRDRLLENGILRATELAIQLLSLKNALPEGVDGEVEPTFKFTGPRYSPDEKVKLTTQFAMLASHPLPPVVLAALLQEFVPIDDLDEVVKALKKAEADMAALAKMKTLVGGGAAEGPKQPSVKDQAGVDKKLR